MNRRVLSDLFRVRHPGDFLREVLQCLGLDERTKEGIPVGQAYRMALSLYQGKLDGYRQCDTRYHDFTHAAETFLAMGRLLHGALLASVDLPSVDIAVGLTAAILHDSGYICSTDESTGNGAGYRSEHESRSMDFVSRHAEALGLDAVSVSDCRLMIQGTMMSQDVNGLTFRSASQELRVRMLSAADLLAQLSSATYLERLAYLFEEDQAAGDARYRDIPDSYRKAIQFDTLARTRIQNHLPQTDSYLAKHFSARWNTPANLYRISMDRQISYLAKAMADGSFDPNSDLRRWSSLNELERSMKLKAGF